jgi:uncharacterized membrane protein
MFLKRLAVIVLVAFSTSVFFAINVHAANGESIKNFDSQVLIYKDGSAHITEDITYDFGSNERHGIYRDVPIDYKDGVVSYYLNATLDKVTNGSGNDIETDTSHEDGNLRIRIGDPDEVITGVHHYKISYELQPVATNKSGTLFLNLDLLGEGWQVPVEKFSATVLLEDGSKLTNIQWYGIDNTSNATAQGQNIAPYQGVTINADLPDGYTTNILESNKKRSADVWSAIAGFSFVVLIAIASVGTITILLIRWWSARTKRKSQTVIPEYDPPAGMLPAEIGYLQDDISDAKEFTATLIDWAVRGAIKINRIESDGLFGTKSVNYELVKMSESTEFTEGEKELFTAIFKKDETVKVKDMSIASEVAAFRKFIEAKLTDKGYYSKDGNIFMRGVLTDSGAKQWAKVDGFKLYLNVAEKDRLVFSDAPEKTPERFNKLLPYAVAFGVEKQWAKQFEGMDVSEGVNWYGGNIAAFSALSLANDVASGLSTAVSTNSSFSSSGGSAGGGVGGGGGGSW